MAPLPIPKHENTLVEDMTAFLTKLPTIVKRDDAPFVYRYPISMADGKEKKKWMAQLNDALAADVKTVQQFFTEKKDGKNCSLALGLMPVHNPCTDGGRDMEKA